jgi:23S rRNA pseudouridine1911/1915/1917 synthase
MKWIVEENSTLFEALSKASSESSKTTLKSWIGEGRIYVDGQPIKKNNALVITGQVVELKSRQRHVVPGIRILHEDSFLIAIDKPCGLLSVATAFEKEKTLHSYIKEKYYPRKVGVVHRLDQEASGVMLFVFSDKVSQKMRTIFERHDIKRIYYAIVEGKMEKSSGTWQSYVYEDANYFVHSTQDPEKGTIAITHYRVKAATNRFSLLEVQLETGRKNQIRVHCKESGHPVVGDKKYGAQTNPLSRLGLHAHFISFAHPVTGKQMSFSSPLPEEFRRVFPLNLAQGG